MSLAIVRRLLSLLVVSLVVVGGAIGVLAYWRTNGTGAALASVGTFAGPTGVGASSTAGTGAVQVTWTGTTAPTGGAVDGYYLQRFAGTTPSPACASSPTSLLASSPTSCNDSSVPVGSYTYKVTAVFRSWTALSSASGAVTVTSPTVTVAATSASPTNAQPVTFAVTFSEAVTDLAAGGLTVTVPAADTGVTKSVSKTDSSHFTVSVAGLKTDGTGDGSVSVSVIAGAVTDLAGDPNLASNSASVTWDRTVPPLTALQMFDTNGNGKIDQVKATFSETLASYTAGTAPWTLAVVPSGGALSSVSVSGAVATLTLTEGAGAADTSVGSFTVALAASATGVRDAAGNQSSFSATAPSDHAAPVLLTLQMFDTNVNGKVDQVNATFSESLASYTAGTTPWTLAGVPSGGTLSSVSVSGAVATLTLTEGGAALDTSVGSFTVTLAANAGGIRDATGNQSSFAATAPADKAAPVLVSLQMFDTNANGKIDQVRATFSETLASYTAGNTPWTLAAVPSGGSLSSVSVSGAVATLTLTEGAGAPDTSVGSLTVAMATNAGGIRDAAANQAPSFAATAPADKASPILVSLQMFDTNTNGKVDQVQATFSEALAAYTAGTPPWTLAAVPSGGTLSSVSVSGGVATLTLTEGGGAADTSAGSFTNALAANAAGIRDAAGNQSSFAATAPADKAAPVLVSATSGGGTAGLMETGNTLTLTFSEPLAPASVPTSATVTELRSGGALGGGGTSTLTIPGVIQSAAINNSYLSLGLLGSTAQGVATGTITLTNGNSTVSIVLGTVASSSNGVGGGVATGANAVAMSPVAAITDPAVNAAITSSSATVTRLF